MNNVYNSKLFNENNILAIIIVFATLIRINYFGLHAFHVDEALYSSWAIRIFERYDFLLNGAAGVDKPPLLFYLQALSFMFFGISENSARLPNFFASIVSIFLVFKIGKHYFNIKVGLLSAWLLSLSSMHIAYSDTAFLDMLMITMALASINFLIEKKYGLAGIFLTLSFSSKQFGIIFYPLVLLLFTLELWKEMPLKAIPKSDQFKSFGKALLASLAILFLITSLSNPTWGFIFHQDVSKIPAETFIEKAGIWIRLYFSLFHIRGLNYFSLVALFYAIIFILIKVGNKQLLKLKALEIFPIVLFVGFSITYFIFLIQTGIFNYSRYALIWAPFVVLTTAFFIDNTLNWLIKRRMIIPNRVIKISAIVIVLLFTGYAGQTLGLQKPNFGAFYSSNDGVEKIADYLKKIEDSDKVLLINGSGWCYNFYANGIKFKKKLDVNNTQDVKTALDQYKNNSIYLSWKKDNNKKIDELIQDKNIDYHLVYSSHDARENRGFQLYVLKNKTKNTDSLKH